jgi:hypothetical protein
VAAFTINTDIVPDRLPAFNGSRWGGRALQLIEPANSLLPAGTTHLFRWLQAATKRWPFRRTEDEAQVVVTKLDAPYARRFSVWHPRNWAGY